MKYFEFKAALQQLLLKGYKSFLIKVHDEYFEPLLNYPEAPASYVDIFYIKDSINIVYPVEIHVFLYELKLYEGRNPLNNNSEVYIRSRYYNDHHSYDAELVLDEIKDEVILKPVIETESTEL